MKGEVLRYAIAFALRRSRKIIRGLKEGLTEEERFAVADHAVAQLKERSDPWRLNEEAPTAATIDLNSDRRHIPRHPSTPRLLSVKPRSPKAGAFSLHDVPSQRVKCRFAPQYPPECFSTPANCPIR